MSETTAPYGSWKSPITADLIVKESIGLSQVQTEGHDIYWIEGRPSEGGRQVIVRQSADGTRTDINPPGFNARTRVHEYGGGDYAVHKGTVYFSNFADQQIYKQTGNLRAVQILHGHSKIETTVRSSSRSRLNATILDMVNLLPDLAAGRKPAYPARVTEAPARAPSAVASMSVRGDSASPTTVTASSGAAAASSSRMVVSPRRRPAITINATPSRCSSSSL